jgi:hypothetical protein
VASLKQEYAILKSLAIPEVANAIALEPVGNGLALIMEDGAGEPVDAIARQRDFGIPEFLRLALTIARAVAAIHDRA